MAKTITKDDYRTLTGLQKTAILLMSAGEESISKLFSMMDDEEIKDISNAMANLGKVDSECVERLFLEFSEEMSAAGVLIGSYDSTQRLLTKALGRERVDSIMDEIRGPAGRTTWDKLANVNEEVLAAFLKNEYPQTIALIISKIRPDHAAKVLSVLPEELAVEVINRMLTMDSVKKEVIEGIERTLRHEFMSNIAKTQRRDSYEMMADIFNNFDRATEGRFMSHLEHETPESAERIRNLMFTFEDLIKIDMSGIQTVLRNLDKEKLALALKGASDELKELFFKNMSERASKILLEDMESMGPVRLKDVDEAQMYVVNVAKELSNKGEITIAEAGGEEQLVY
ncbi:MAG: flagellar motor switch protein FliG [Alphaproteobacteria bacterium]|nr:MAG: flagellar motor switch protein FliG [Alphaproteobacteria bacterium]TAF38655.1 MAG: flagellar motor switch protein FliG [Alphaproteobacteria bacterium]TAF76291.1 MAG: flagellar motor switch protein FliG [Alphaproteobacteria bacterium]